MSRTRLRGVIPARGLCRRCRWVGLGLARRAAAVVASCAGVAFGLTSRRFARMRIPPKSSRAQATKLKTTTCMCTYVAVSAQARSQQHTLLRRLLRWPPSPQINHHTIGKIIETSRCGRGPTEKTNSPLNDLHPEMAEARWSSRVKVAP